MRVSRKIIHIKIINMPEGGRGEQRVLGLFLDHSGVCREQREALEPCENEHIFQYLQLSSPAAGR